MSTSLMKLLVFLFTLDIYQNYKEMITLYNIIGPLPVVQSFHGPLYFCYELFFFANDAISPERLLKIQTSFVFPQKDPGPPPWQFLSQPLLGSSRNREALRDDPYDGCEGDCPVAFGLFQIACDFEQRVCGQANGRYTSHITLRCVTLLTVKVEHNRKPKKSSMKIIRQNQTRLK